VIQTNRKTRAILQRDDTNPDALYVRGYGLYRNGNHSQALLHAKRLIAFNPDDSRAIKLLRLIQRVEKGKEEANEAFKAGRYEEAINLYDQGMECDPDNDKFNATLLCNKAAALMKLKKWKEAISACSKAINRDSTYTKAYKRRATCYTQEGEYEDAVRDLNEALERDPNDQGTPSPFGTPQRD
jgi:DnaJ homolog subfamily C member 7